MSLMRHVTKVLLMAMQKCIANNIDQECINLKSEFKSRTGTTEEIFYLQAILERVIEV